jgi:hypothetical protein
MADNTSVTPGTGIVIASDDIGGVQHQRVKVVIGNDGISNGDISSTNPMPVSGTVTANTGLSQPLTDTQLRATSVPVSGIVNSQYIDSNTTGTITGTSNVEINTSGMATVAFQTTGSWSGSIKAQGTIDGSNWYDETILFDGGTIGSTFSSNNIGVITAVGHAKIRLIGATVTGTANITLRSTPTNGYVALNAALPNGGNNIGSITNITGTISLPTGAATATNQSTEITALGTINTTLGSPMQSSGGSVTANAGTNLNTSALALESGGHLASVDTKTPALGQALAASSVPVVLTAAQLATLTPVSSVSVSNFPATQPVSGTVAISNSSIEISNDVGNPIPVSGTVTANTGLSQPITDTQLRATAVPVSGSISVSNFPATQPVSATSLPLPTGASTEATLAAVDAKLAQFEFGNDGRVRTGQETLIFFDQINGSTINSEIWKATSATMTATQTNGALVLNSGSSLAVNTYYNLSSTKAFNRIFEFPIYLEAQASFTQGNTETVEFGFISAATNAAPTDGFFFRGNPSGIFAVSCVGGVETSVAMTGAVPGVVYETEVIIHSNYVFYELKDVNGVQISTTINVFPGASSNPRLPIMARVYNGGTIATTASSITLYAVTVLQMDWATNKLFDAQLASSSHSFCQIEPTTFIKTANWANSTAPAVATLSNTAAGYTTLGGYFRFTTTATLSTDYALFAYQVPVGYTLVLNGIGIDSAVTTAMGATATVLSWAAGLGASAVSLATTDVFPTSSAPKFIPIGFQNLLASAPVGTSPTPLLKSFKTPIVIEGGEYFHIILRIISGSTTGQITGMVSVDGYFE